MELGDKLEKENNAIFASGASMLAHLLLSRTQRIR